MSPKGTFSIPTGRPIACCLHSLSDQPDLITVPSAPHHRRSILTPSHTGLPGWFSHPGCLSPVLWIPLTLWYTVSDWASYTRYTVSATLSHTTVCLEVIPSRWSRCNSGTSDILLINAASCLKEKDLEINPIRYVERPPYKTGQTDFAGSLMIQHLSVTLLCRRS